MKRQCETCGRTYLRRNLVEVWTTRNPGHRAGWAKRKIRQCLNCQPLTLSLELVKVTRKKVR